MIERDDPEGIEQAVLEWAEQTQAKHPEIRQIYWFGSRISGGSTAYSDVDLCLVLSSSPFPRWFDRIDEYRPAGFSVPVDIFPYTEEEFSLLRENRPSFYREIVSGRRLYSDRALRG